MQTTYPIRKPNEEGFLLVAVIVMAALILIALAVAAPSVAKDMQREKELETVHRGNDYVRAIRKYYQKNNAYPGSIDALIKSNNIRWLRQKWTDPLTGKDDWRIIHPGENKTTVTGFFGQPLAGLATTGIGSAQGMLSTPGGGATPTTAATSSGGAGNTGCATGTASAAFGNSTFGGADCAPATSTGTGGSTGTGSSVGSTDATTFSGSGGGPIMGVGLPVSKTSIIEIRKQTTYDTWEFIYDPRIEMLYAKANSIFGGAGSSINGAGSGGASNLTPSTTGGSSTPGGTGGGTGSGSGSSFGFGGSSSGSGSNNNSPFSNGP